MKKCEPLHSNVRLLLLRDNRFHKRGLLPTPPVEPTKLMLCASVVRDNRTLSFSYS